MTKDEARIEELVRSQLQVLVRFAERWRNADAESVVQEAFLKLMTQEVFPDDPVSWLFITVRNMCNNERRSFWRRKHREFDVQAGKGLFDVFDIEQCGDVEQLLKDLASFDLEYREIVVAKVWDGLTLEEIAKMMGMSRSSVQRKYHKGIQVLREKWSANGDGYKGM